MSSMRQRKAYHFLHSSHSQRVGGRGKAALCDELNGEMEKLKRQKQG